MLSQMMGAVLISSLMVQAASAAESYVFKTKEPQQMAIINTGSLSLQKRLQMIESAKRTIEVEFFIYNIDEAGRLFTQALVKKAREGVQVRVLIDYGWPIAKLDTFYATLLEQNGVQVRYYNPNVSFELLKGQFRSHRKALIVDDNEGMTGGRNIADEYFDLSPEYNFIDRDVYVRGSVARAMRESFERFWSSELTKKPDLEKAPVASQYGVDVYGPQANSRYQSVKARFDAGMKKANDYLLQNDKDRQVLESLKGLAALEDGSVRMHTCNDTMFAADIPGIGSKSRVLFQEITAQLNDVRKSIYVESPYFVTTKNGMSFLKNYLQKGLDINVYTNSLNSTDAVYTTATFYPRVGELIQDGMKVFIYKGASLTGQDFISPEVQQARWGIHAKSAVLDEKTIMVGTFNVDPRSRNINAEMAVICRDNPQLAAEVLTNMKEHQAQSVQLNGAGKPVDGSSAFANVSVPKRIMYYLSAPLSNVFDFLL
ncbi:MAG: phospholipase D family protein [Bdellovibrionales bacterium]|nr:phospholipase D family protein [Bdellovibrionales bacterium]